MKKLLWIVLCLPLLSFAAKQAMVYSPKTCSKIPTNSQHILLILKKGTDILKGVSECVVNGKIKGASILGLGAIANPTLGYYDLSQHKFLRHTFPGDYEIANLTGNVSYADGKPVIHIHTVIGDGKFQAFAGHLFSGTVAVTTEITLTLFHASPIRKFDKQTGLKLIQPNK